MTATSENPHDRIDRLEATLTRFAELSFQSYRHHDETLSRLEANMTRLEASSTRHDEALNRLEASSAKHDQAITQLLEVTARNSEAVNRHDETLKRLEANADRMEQAITNLTTTVANNNTRLTDRLDAIAEQSADERETFIAEIREIWRYLRYQPGNGRTGHDNA